MQERGTLLTHGGRAPALSGILAVGDVIAGYRIVDRAGDGGMGVVYRAVDLELGRAVALKVIAPEFARDERFRELFKAESRKAAGLEHPNVIPIYRSGEEDGQLYIAMRFVEGATLQELIDRRGRLPVGAAVRIVSQIADALDAAHAHGLVHRDVKPGNVLVADASGEEHVYLTDFGLSILTAEARPAGEGRYAGTPAYLAPEQIRGTEIDGRTDVYALGCVLFHALTGRPPFQTKGFDATVLAHMTEAPPNVTAIVPGLPAKLDDVVRTAMAKRPEARFATAGELAAAARTARSDVVICHHPDDGVAARSLASRLSLQGLDARIAGGDAADDLWSAHACLVVVGRADLAGWARDLLAAAGDITSIDPRFRLVSVLIPGAPEPFDPRLAFLASRAFVDLRGGLDDPHAVADLLRAVDAAPPVPLASDAIAGELCPYRGLEAFREEDTALFFGRERETALVREKLRDSRFLAVLGASGSGKSSLVRAGLLPLMRAEGDARIVALTPGATPLAALAAQLEGTVGVAAPSAAMLADDTRTLDRVAEQVAGGGDPGRLIVVVDQFEEVFSLAVDATEQRAFIDNLVYAATIPGGRTTVVLAMRSDFYHRCADHLALRALVAQEQFLVGPLGPDGLRSAIEEPARHAGLELERGLVRRILADVSDQPGALPLLEHLLLELWRRRRGRFLTLEGYAESGGVSGALAKRANTVYDGFDPDEQAIARRVLLRLTQPGEGTEDTRRRAPLDELVLTDGERPAVEHVVQALSSARLLVTARDEATGEPAVEVTHEALIRGWPELRSWIDRDRESLRLHRRLTEATDEWQGGGRDDGLLYRGARLAVWQDRPEDELNERERSFLAASREAAERDRLARRKRLRLAFAGMGAAVVAVGGIAGVATSQWRSATRERETARSRQIAGSATLVRQRDPELALLLALEAFRTKPTVQAEEALRQSAHESKVRGAFRREGVVLNGVKDLGGGRVLVAGDDGSMFVWDFVRDPRGVAAIDLGQWAGGITQAAVVSAGYVGVGSDGSVVFWPRTGGKPRRIGRQPGPVNYVRALPDGESVLVTSDAGVWEWEPPRQRGRRVFVGPSVVADITGQPGAYLVIDANATLKRVVHGRGEQIPVQGSVQNFKFSPDRRLLAVGTDSELQVWRYAAHPSLLRSAAIAKGVNDITFAPDGRHVAVAAGDGSLQVFATPGEEAADTAPLVPAARMLGHHGALSGVTFAAGGRLVSVGTDGSARTWAWDDGSGQRLEAGPLPQRGGVHLDPDGTVIVIGADGAVRMWEPARGVRSLLPATGEAVSAAAVRGRLVITAATDGRIVARRTDRSMMTERSVSGSPVTVAIDPSGQRVAASTFEGTVAEVPLAGSTPARTLAKGESPSFTVAYGPDGQIAYGNQDGSIFLIRGGRSVKLGADSGPVFAVVFSPNGRQLATAGADQVIQVWDTSSGKLIQSLRGHDALVNGLAFVAAGDRLVSAAGDGIRFWDWRRGVTLLTLSIPDGVEQVEAAGATPTIAYYDLKNTVSVSNCDVCGSTDDVIKLVSQRTTRELTPAERTDFQVAPVP